MCSKPYEAVLSEVALARACWATYADGRRTILAESMRWRSRRMRRQRGNRLKRSTLPRAALDVAVIRTVSRLDPSDGDGRLSGCYDATVPAAERGYCRRPPLRGRGRRRGGVSSVASSRPGRVAVVEAGTAPAFRRSAASASGAAAVGVKGTSRPAIPDETWPST